jgi:hypothetical protein
MEGAEGGANAEGSVDADDDIGDQARALIQAAVRGESVTLPEDSELKRRILDLLPQHMSHVSEPPRYGMLGFWSLGFDTHFGLVACPHVSEPPGSSSSTPHVVTLGRPAMPLPIPVTLKLNLARWRQR